MGWEPCVAAYAASELGLACCAPVAPPPPSLSTSSVGLLAGVQGRGRRGAGVGSELRKKGSIAVWALFSVPYCLYLVIIVQSWTN